MITLTLPSEDRRVQLQSFWFTLSALATVPWLALAGWLHAPVFVAAGLAAAVLIGVVGVVAVVHEGFVWRVYHAWNRRLVRPFGVTAARAVMAVCFFVVFVVVGKAGSRMRLAGQGGASTSWTSRASLSRDAYGALFAAASPGGASGAWIPNYLRWAKQTGNLWSVSLLPFLAVLKLLSVEEEQAAQANIYTLF